MNTAEYAKIDEVRSTLVKLERELRGMIREAAPGEHDPERAALCKAAGLIDDAWSALVTFS